MSKKAEKPYVPTVALVRLKDATMRAHQANNHGVMWEDCGSPECVRDRRFLGSHGVLGRNRKKLR